MINLCLDLAKFFQFFLSLLYSISFHFIIKAAKLILTFQKVQVIIRMSKSKRQPVNPENNETQKMHEKLDQRRKMQMAQFLPDYAGPFFNTYFKKRFNFKPNLPLKHSLTKIAGSLLPNPIRPDRTDYRNAICLNIFINYHWGELGPIMNSFIVINLGKGNGYKIIYRSQKWQTDADGNIRIQYPNPNRKRGDKRDLQKDMRESINEMNFPVHLPQFDAPDEKIYFSDFENFESDYNDDFSDAILCSDH